MSLHFCARRLLEATSRHACLYLHICVHKHIDLRSTDVDISIYKINVFMSTYVQVQTCFSLEITWDVELGIRVGELHAKKVMVI